MFKEWLSFNTFQENFDVITMDWNPFSPIPKMKF